MPAQKCFINCSYQKNCSMEHLEPYFQFIILFVWFLLKQQNTWKRIQSYNRSISPGSVWLQLIPLYGLVWQFFVVARIADSLSRELSFRETTFSFELEPEITIISDHTRPTYSIGLAYCILMCISYIPMLNLITIIPAIYWVKLTTYKNKLNTLSTIPV